METVILIHGIWVGRWVMKPLAGALTEQGYDARLFSYPSVKQSPRENSALLAQFTESINTDTCHFIAHSLGGILLLNYFEQFPQQRPGSLVLLGSPVNGSLKSKKILKLPFGKNLLGKSVSGGLVDGGLRSPPGHRTGMIAGNRALGLGQLLGPFFQPNDGTVAVAETRLDDLTDHLVIKTSHTGMLLSKKVAQQAICFIRNGQFKR